MGGSGSSGSSGKSFGRRRRSFAGFGVATRFFLKERGQAPSVSLSPCCPQGLVTSYAPGSEKHEALQAKVQELLNKQVIAEVPEGCPAFHNRVFLRPKRTGDGVSF